MSEIIVYRLKDLKDQAHDQEFVRAINPNREIYTVRQDDVHINKREIIRIPSYRIGDEFVKTLGYHAVFAVDMEVLSGTAHILVQKDENLEAKIVQLIKLRVGNAYKIPRFYDYVIINPSMSNDILEIRRTVHGIGEVPSDTIRIKRGTVYYELINGSFAINTNYGIIPQLEIHE